MTVDSTTDWKAEFAQVGAFWEHDGNPRRPYALLTSGKISNGFFNGGKVAEHGLLFGRACTALWHTARSPEPRDGYVGITDENLRVVGAEKGGISLSTRIAEAALARAAYAEKVGDALVFKRFELSSSELFLLVEDTITTGGTLQKLADAVAEACNAKPVFAEAILAFCNRSGKMEIDGLPIVSLISPDFTTWELGENPFTPDGKELVPPVRPKENWDALTRTYL